MWHEQQTLTRCDLDGSVARVDYPLLEVREAPLARKGVPMERSDAVRAAFLRFADRLSAGDVAVFDDLVSSDPATVVVGTAPGEIVRDRDRLRFGFEAEGLQLIPSDPEAYEEGTIGWILDEPSFVFPDNSQVKMRMTLVFRREDDDWKLVQMHASVGVPDEEVQDLQRRWGTAQT